MSKATNNEGKSKAKSKAPANKGAQEIKPVGEPVNPPQTDASQGNAPQEATAKGARKKKNYTGVEIDLNNLESADKYLEAFYKQSEEQPPTNGYDQHWNKEGFIHAGPAKRLPCSGAINMIVFLADILAKRELAKDPTAAGTIDFARNYLQHRRDLLKRQEDDAILEKARKVEMERSRAS
jgi:hypothetical protein